MKIFRFFLWANLVLFLLYANGSIFSQIKIGDNPLTINSDAILEIESTTKGMLIPRLGLTASNLASPLASFTEGMLVYNTSNSGSAPYDVVPGFYYCDGTKWIPTQSYLQHIALVNSSSPAGVIIGELRYNDNPAIGLPLGPIYWDGSQWLSSQQTAMATFYSSDGNLTGNRTVYQDTNGITFTGTGEIRFNSGSVGVNIASPDPSAIVDISSLNKGFLMPRMTMAQRDAIPNPALGLMVYCIDCFPVGLYFNNSPGVANWASSSNSSTGSANLDCFSASVNGTYSQGVAMVANNYITVPVYVASTGSYSISSNSVNGVSFSGGGVFTSLGTANITLYAQGGDVPLANGTYTYTITMGSSVCSISIPYTSSVPSVSSLNCNGGTTNTPTLITGVAVPSGYTFSIPYTAGNGASFSGSFASSSHPGLLATASSQNLNPAGGSLTFTVSGTPSADGVITFPITVDSQNCNYTGLTASTGLSFTTVTSGSNFTIPAGIAKATIKVWGAAGRSDGGYFGGYGGFVSGTVDVTPGETLIARVGQGGILNATATNGGGYNGGGGYSGVFRVSTPILIGGGGGGVGENDDASSGRECTYVYGGSAGAVQGMAGGRYAVGGVAQTIYLNTGGSQTAGGTGSEGVNGGSYLQGGAGTTGYMNGAGGGGGYYGGGGGTYRNNNISGDDGGGGGAGGSNFVAATGVTNSTNLGQTTCVSTNTISAPGSTDSDYNTTLHPAKPMDGANGSNGMVIVKWSY